jgi:ABC-type Mn2+/Zn2+ transport system permease subunit
MVFAIFAVVIGLFISFYASIYFDINLPAGGAIVSTSVVIFLMVMIYKNRIG